MRSEQRPPVPLNGGRQLLSGERWINEEVAGPVVVDVVLVSYVETWQTQIGNEAICLLILERFELAPKLGTTRVRLRELSA